VDLIDCAMFYSNQSCGLYFMMDRILVIPIGLRRRHYTGLLPFSLWSCPAFLQKCPLSVLQFGSQLKCWSLEKALHPYMIQCSNSNAVVGTSLAKLCAVTIQPGGRPIVQQSEAKKVGLAASSTAACRKQLEESERSKQKRDQLRRNGMGKS